MLFRLDNWLVSESRQHSEAASRIALAVIFVWFGALKVIGMSPAGALVESLLSVTLPGAPFDRFFVAFGTLEVIIGLLFLFPKYTRAAILLLVVHLATTLLPLFLLLDVTWAAPFVPTLEGQYIIKNVALVALALAMASHIQPMHKA